MCGGYGASAQTAVPPRALRRRGGSTRVHGDRHMLSARNDDDDIFSVAARGIIVVLVAAIEPTVDDMYVDVLYI